LELGKAQVSISVSLWNDIQSLSDASTAGSGIGLNAEVSSRDTHCYFRMRFLFGQAGKNRFADVSPVLVVAMFGISRCLSEKKYFESSLSIEISFFQSKALKVV
jgi:hypothetical protein